MSTESLQEKIYLPGTIIFSVLSLLAQRGPLNGRYRVKRCPKWTFRLLWRNLIFGQNQENDHFILVLDNLQSQISPVSNEFSRIYALGILDMILGKPGKKIDHSVFPHFWENLLFLSVLFVKKLKIPLQTWNWMILCLSPMN